MEELLVVVSLVSFLLGYITGTGAKKKKVDTRDQPYIHSIGLNVDLMGKVLAAKHFEKVNGIIREK